MTGLWNDCQLRPRNAGCIVLGRGWRDQSILLAHDDQRWAGNTRQEIGGIGPLRHASRSGRNALRSRFIDQLPDTRLDLVMVLAHILREQAWHLEVSDRSCA